MTISDTVLLITLALYSIFLMIFGIVSSNSGDMFYFMFGVVMFIVLLLNIVFNSNLFAKRGKDD